MTETYKITQWQLTLIVYGAGSRIEWPPPSVAMLPQRVEAQSRGKVRRKSMQMSSYTDALVSSMCFKRYLPNDDWRGRGKCPCRKDERRACSMRAFSEAVHAPLP